MSSSKECREFADECMGWAKAAQSEREQRVFLQMAETWLRAAIMADRRERIRSAATSSQQPSGPSVYESGGSAMRP